MTTNNHNKLLPLLLLICLSGVSSSSGGNAFLPGRFLREEKPSVPCNVKDLSDDCTTPDEPTVIVDDLVQQCDGKWGIPAAQCYMEFLCENDQDQDLVDRHKACINMECPKAKHLPTLKCAEHNGAADTDTTESETTDNAEDETEETTEEEPETEPESSETPEGEEDPIPCTVEDLTNDCSTTTDNVKLENILSECGPDLHGIPAAVCYMTYLCEYHSQEDVIQHKECIDRECPLAKDVPVANCENPGEELLIDEPEVEVTKAPSGSSGGGDEGMGFGSILVIMVVTVGVAGFLVVYRWQVLGATLRGIDWVTGKNPQEHANTVIGSDLDMPGAARQMD